MTASPTKTEDVRPSLPPASLARWAAYLAVLMGAALLLHGLQTFFDEVPPPRPYSTALCVIGLLEAGLSWLVLRVNRPAWSFLVSLNGTMFVVFLFAATKIRDQFEIALALALLPSLLFGAVCMLTAFAHDDF